MSRKKGYKSRLPTVLPPTPRPALDDGSPSRARPTAATPTPRPEPRAQPAPSMLPAVRRPTAEPAQNRSRRVVVAVVLLVPSLLATAGLVLALLAGTRDDPTSGTPPAPVGPQPESYVDARVLASGDIVVRHLIRTDGAVRGLTIGVPALPAGSAVSGTHVRVRAGGLPVEGPRRIDSAAVTYRFPPTTDLDVTYRIVGALHLSGSAPGRALAITTALDVRHAGRAEVEVRSVTADEVLSLACAASADQAPEPCGATVAAGRWEVELPEERAGERVVAQVTVADAAPDEE